MVETDLENIRPATENILKDNEFLWLHKNQDELRQRVEETIGHKTPLESIPRCRRDIFEEAVMKTPGFNPQKCIIIKDEKILEEYIRVSRASQEKYQRLFMQRTQRTYGKTKGIYTMEDNQEILRGGDYL